MSKDLITLAEADIDRFIDNMFDFTTAQNLEAHLEAERTRVKLDAIIRLMKTTNELTGTPYSASAAEKVVELDPEYARHLKTQRDTVVTKNHHWASATSARLRAELRIAQVTLAGADVLREAQGEVAKRLSKVSPEGI